MKLGNTELEIIESRHLDEIIFLSASRKPTCVQQHSKNKVPSSSSTNLHSCSRKCFESKFHNFYILNSFNDVRSLGEFIHAIYALS